MESKVSIRSKELATMIPISYRLDFVFGDEETMLLCLRRLNDVLEILPPIGAEEIFAGSPPDLLESGLITLQSALTNCIYSED